MAFHGGLLGVIVAMALFARSRKRAVPRGDRPGRAVRADRLRRRPHRQLHQRRAVGPLRRPERCRGRWSSRSRARRCRATRRSSTSSRSRGCCCSSCCGSTRKKPRGLGQVSGAFLVGYGVLRFIAEFFREPDSFLGLLALDMSMGQWLCVPMIVAGVALWLWGRGRVRRPPPRRRCAPSRPEPTMRQIFLDTETTGLSPESGDRIIEIGCVEIVNRRLTGRNDPLLRQPRAAQQRRRAARCTASPTSSSPTSRCSRTSSTS